MENLSKNFPVSEFVYSAKAEALGIDNAMPYWAYANARDLAANVLQPLRDYLDASVSVSSGYRSPELNKEVNGEKSSQHLKGEAADIKTKRLREAFFYILQHLEYDQLIWEYGTTKAPAWIHVSYRRGANRRQALRIYRDQEGLKKTIAFDLKA